MKTITLPEFEAQAKEVALGAFGWEPIRVNCKGKGKFVIVDESDYDVMQQALKTVIQAANMDDTTYKSVMRAAKAAGIKGSYGRLDWQSWLLNEMRMAITAQHLLSGKKRTASQSVLPFEPKRSGNLTRS